MGCQHSWPLYCRKLEGQVSRSSAAWACIHSRWIQLRATFFYRRRAHETFCSESQWQHQQSHFSSVCVFVCQQTDLNFKQFSLTTGWKTNEDGCGRTGIWVSAMTDQWKHWVQRTKGLPLKINAKYTEISHLWSEKFAGKTQGAIFCLTESNWSNNLWRGGRRESRGGGSPGKEKRHDRTYPNGDLSLLWKRTITTPEFPLEK